MNFRNRAIEILATWFYLGKAPFAPGTFGTFGAIPVVLLMGHLNPIAYMTTTLFFCVFSILVAELRERALGTHDASEIVIDEVAGFMVTMTWLPMTWQSFVFGFALFRFFDAVKPFPISWFDKKIKGGVGVVVDDLVAGLISSVILQFIYSSTTWLGAQLVQQ